MSDTAPPPSDPDLADGREQLAAAEERRFAELRALEEGWDSYGSSPVQEGVEDRAKTILAILRARPLICPTSEGGIALEWHTDDAGSIEIEVEPQGVVSVYIEDRELEDADQLHARARIAALEAECERREREDRIRIVGGYLPAVMTVPEVRRYLGSEVDG